MNQYLDHPLFRIHITKAKQKAQQTESNQKGWNSGEMASEFSIIGQKNSQCTTQVASLSALIINPCMKWISCIRRGGKAMREGSRHRPSPPSD